MGIDNQQKRSTDYNLITLRSYKSKLTKVMHLNMLYHDSITNADLLRLKEQLQNIDACLLWLVNTSRSPSIKREFFEITNKDYVAYDAKNLKTTTDHIEFDTI